MQGQVSLFNQDPRKKAGLGEDAVKMYRKLFPEGEEGNERKNSSCGG
ncbi:MAG: hypothetical protein GXZ07_01275 [Firmicutes bacterium]|nr:hypothetical protein [Bacillota bacterium]